MYYPVKEYVSRGAAEGAEILKAGGGMSVYLAMWPGVCSLSRRVSVMYDVKSTSLYSVLTHNGDATP